MIVGIDPSLSRTAVCIGNVHHSLATFGSNPCAGDIRSRLARFEQLVADIDAHLRTLGSIGGIFIEGYAMGVKWGREQAGEFGGLLRWHLLDLSPTIVEVSPQALKKFAVGRINAEKDMVAAHLTNRYGVLLAGNDEYDAFALWQIGHCYMGSAEPANAAQAEVIDALRAGPKQKPRKGKKQSPPAARPF